MSPDERRALCWLVVWFAVVCTVGIIARSLWLP